MYSRLVIYGCLSAYLLAGCGSRGDLSGGTSGFLYSEGQPLADVMISVHHDGRSNVRPLGIGITDWEGRFELRTEDLMAPLFLEPGTYRFTIDSIGEVYLAWSRNFSDPTTTPLIEEISSPEQPLVFDVPLPRVGS